jgi:hypothetical protein
MFIISLKSYQGDENILDVVETYDDLLHYIKILLEKNTELKYIDEFDYRSRIPDYYSIPFAEFNYNTYNVRKMEFVKEPSFD